MEQKSVLDFVYEELKSRKLHKGKPIDKEVIKTISYKLHVPYAGIEMYIDVLRSSGRIK